MTEPAPGHPEILRIVAPNPGPLTGAGTNSYLYGSNPCVVIDPGAEDPGHLESLRLAGERLGGIAAVLISHEHPDHTGGADRLGAPVIRPADGEVHGGLEVLATPGHAQDHVCFFTASEGGVCFSADLVLGEGFSMVPPDGGSLIAYLDSLRRIRERSPNLICPGHGPWVTDPDDRIANYIEHRLERERRLLSALERGVTSRAELLDEVWDDAPPVLREFAALTMQAHLEKLEIEDRLPVKLGDLSA